MAPASDMFKAAAAPTAPQRPRRTAQPPAPRPAAAVAGLLLLALLAPPAAADDCYVDLAVAAGAQFCIGGSFKYLTGLISYPTTLKCGGSSPFSSGALWKGRGLYFDLKRVRCVAADGNLHACMHVSACVHQWHHSPRMHAATPHSRAARARNPAPQAASPRRCLAACA